MKVDFIHFLTRLKSIPARSKVGQTQGKKIESSPMEAVLSLQIEELTRLQEEERQKLLETLEKNEQVLAQVRQCKSSFS